MTMNRIKLGFVLVIVSMLLTTALATSPVMADGTLLSNSITDQLLDTSHMYSVSSSELNGTLFIHGGSLPYDPLDTSGGAGVAQRGGGTGYQFMEYKAVPGKRIAHVKVSWMVFNTDNQYDGRIKLFDGADQVLSATDTHVLTDPDGWRWHVTECDLATVNLNSVRVGFVYGYSWEPQVGTVQITVDDPTTNPVSYVIDDTLADQQSWYASSNLWTCVPGLQDPFSTDNYLAQRLPENGGNEAWFSYKASPGTKFTAAAMCYAFSAGEPSPVYFQVKTGNTWVTWPIRSTQDSWDGGDWVWEKDNFTALSADEVRVYIPPSPASVWWRPLVGRVTLTVTGIPAISRGHQILLDRGLQLQTQTMLFQTGYWSQSDWQNSNFSTVNVHWGSDLPILAPIGDPGTFTWGRFTGQEGGPSVRAGEAPYVPYLTSLQFMDEVDITDPAVLALTRTWLMNMHSDPTFDNTLGFVNTQGSLFTQQNLADYMAQASPDMLLFDHYPFGTDSTVGGSPTQLYRIMVKTRLAALGGNDGSGQLPIPYGMYLQAYVPGGGYRVSESEIRLNQFSAWAFGYKFASAFCFDGPDSSSSLLFAGSDAARTRTAEFYEFAETNRQSRNLGPALVKLLSTDVRIVTGPNSDSNNDIPAWSNTADPYLKSIAATNLGTLNGGQPGDVLTGFFKPLTGAGNTNERYFMVVNGLTDGSGSAAQTRQRIRLEFDFGTSGITALQRLSRDTGQVEEVALVHDSGSIYHLDLVLDGGTGDLFKYKDGAQFIGIPVVIANLSDALNAAVGTEVSITSPKVVTASRPTFTDGSYYIQNEDRSCGIKVVPADSTQVVTGDRITLLGVVQQDENEQKYIGAASVTSRIAGAEAMPLGMGGKTVAGAEALSSGLLIRVWGQITYVSPDASYAYINDGSGIDDTLGHTGVRVVLGDLATYITKSLSGHYVAITGLAGKAKESSTVVPAIRPRGDNDIDLVN
ncbi:MAG: hypothetical protein ACYC64_04345 [Armatimonadota bacterium]